MRVFTKLRPQISLLAVGLLVLIGCGSDSRPESFLPAHRLVIYPTTITLAPNATHTITADNWGGAAVPFTTDWSIQEGIVGGTLSTPRTLSTTSEVTYTAPATAGRYHIIAADHDDPSHFTAVCDVTVAP